MTDAELYTRGIATVVASWGEYARGAAGASLQRLGGVTAAVFPSGPERGFFNNAVLDRDLGPAERAAAVDAMEAAYGAAGIDHYAAWVHERDQGMRAELSGRGFTVEDTTRAMGMPLDGVPRGHSAVAEVESSDWAEHLRLIGVSDLSGGGDPSPFRVLVARDGGENAATAVGFDHHGDSGLFNMATLEKARRRGLGTALTARHVHDAASRGCSSASLQSTPMGERVYAAIGFRDLGRILEYVP